MRFHKPMSVVPAAGTSNYIPQIVLLWDVISNLIPVPGTGLLKLMILRLSWERSKLTVPLNHRTICYKLVAFRELLRWWLQKDSWYVTFINLNSSFTQFAASYKMTSCWVFIILKRPYCWMVFQPTDVIKFFFLICAGRGSVSWPLTAVGNAWHTHTVGILAETEMAFMVIFR